MPLPISIHASLNAELEAKSLPMIDISSVFLSGGSAGAYLTLQGGHMLEPQPKALLSM